MKTKKLCKLSADVVSGSLTLLISKHAMKRMRMRIEVDTDTISCGVPFATENEVNDRLYLRKVESSKGHDILPLLGADILERVSGQANTNVNKDVNLKDGEPHNPSVVGDGEPYSDDGDSFVLDAYYNAALEWRLLDTVAA